MALLCSYTCIPYYPLLDYSGYDRVCVEACIGLSYKALGRFLLDLGFSTSLEKIVSVMIGSLEESAVFSTICFSGSTIANAVERLTKSCDKRASLRTRERGSRSHSRLGSYEGQNEDWYGLENKEEEQEDSSDSETRRRPTRSTAARRSRVIGRQLEELQRHNRVIYLALYKRGRGVARRKKNVDKTLKMLRGVTTDVQLQQLANCMRIPYVRGRIASYTLTVSVIFDRRRNSSDIWQTV
ncbi:hypothetical protein ALC57_16265 [Trachymyrmex cornetzi]|uniref:Uncharacterized protein n=1 Tax=Trachymyrmex cornetzi TaxID=471704 RepID=A0A151IV89_9HYME|nr:hypothetical protein ALC57_16265 [Trachymyrmex cornetzi]